MLNLMRSSRALKILFLLIAAFATAMVIGGEFLHEHIHDHQTAASHEECPLHQLQIQSFIAFVVFLSFFALKLVSFSLPVFETAIRHVYRLSSSPRAPPLSLL